MTLSSDPADDAKAARALGRYAHAIDSGDVDAVLACLTHDAVLEYEGGEIRLSGRDEIRAFLSDKLVGASTHLISNVVVDIGDEGPFARASAIVCVTRDAGTVHVRGIQYETLYADGADGLRIARLRHRPIWQFAAPNDF